MHKNRLEAFSDGVLAIVIMVLEIKVPHGATADTLSPLLPVFFSYVLSFIYVGIYWNNHHHMLHAAKKVSGEVLWANLHLLFWLSLLPFASGWMGANLCYAHIFCGQFPSMGDSRETLQSMEHGNGAGLGFRSISFPSTQSGDNPCGLGEGSLAMRVLLFFGFSLKSRQQSLQDCNFIESEHLSGLDGTSAIAGQGQLHGTHGCLEGQTGQFG